MKKNFYRKDWVLFEEVANEGGRVPADLLEVNAKVDDPETNKHVPFIEETNEGYKVKVGKNEFHAVEAEHHSMFIELTIDDKYSLRRFLHTGDTPEVEFKIEKGKKVVAYAFCNLHGMWKYELK